LIGEIPEGGIIHRIISDFSGRIKFIAEKGEYTVNDTVLLTEDGKEIKLYSTHPDRTEDN